MINEIDIIKLLNDEKYKILLIEYHSFTSYIISEFNKWSQQQIVSSSIKFHKESKVYEIKDDLFEMLKKTFPNFDISVEKYGDRYDLDENEYSIVVSWHNYNYNYK